MKIESEISGVTLEAEIIDAAQPGAWDKFQDPEIKEMREEARRRAEDATAPTLEEFQAREQAAFRVWNAIQKRKEARAAGLGPGVVALVRQAPSAPGADPGPWEVVSAPASDGSTRR